MSLIVGVDAGAFHTEAVAGKDPSRPMTRRSGGPGAVQPDSAESAAQVIAGVVRRAVADVKPGASLDAIVIGAAGAGHPETRGALEEAMQAELEGRFRLSVTTDVAIALDAAFPDHGSGIVINAGSGSIGSCRDGAGVLWRVGGIGWRIGDEGSGYALGRAGLAAVARAADGRGPDTELSDRIVRAVGMQAVDDLLRWAHSADHAAIVGLARHVAEAARGGDAPARGLVTAAARDLAAHVAALLRRFPNQERVSVALCGGLLRSDSPVRAALAEVIAAEMPTVELRDEPVDPPLGALAMAAKMVE